MWGRDLKYYFPEVADKRRRGIFPFFSAFSKTIQGIPQNLDLFSTTFRTRLLNHVFPGQGRDKVGNFASFPGHFEVDRRPSRTSWMMWSAKTKLFKACLFQTLLQSVNQGHLKTVLLDELALYSFSWRTMEITKPFQRLIPYRTVAISTAWAILASYAQLSKTSKTTFYNDQPRQNIN